jgi:hypothetical protein
MTEPQEQTFDPIHDLANKLCDHPRFNLAALYYFENIMKWRREIGFVDKFISGYARQMILYYVCFTHFRNQTGLPENGATYTRIWQLVEHRNECGSRALRTILGIATLTGYLKKVAGLIDKRVVSYVPTSALLESTNAHFSETLKCLDIIFEVDFYSKEVAKDPLFASKVIPLIGGPILLNKLKFIEINPLLAKVARSSGGLATLFNIAEAGLKNNPLPHPKKIAKTGKFSTSQIRVNIQYLRDMNSISLDHNNNVLVDSECIKFNKMVLARELALHIKYRLGVENFNL